MDISYQYYSPDSTDNYATAPPMYEDEFYSSQFSTNVQHLSQTLPGKDQIPTPTNESSSGQFVLSNRSTTITTPTSLPTTSTPSSIPSKSSQESYIHASAPDQSELTPPETRRKLSEQIFAKLSMVFPMWAFTFQEFDLFTAIVFLITLPITLFISNVKMASVALREYLWKKQQKELELQQKEKILQRQSKTLSHSLKKSVHIPSTTNPERYDVLYRALKKAAFNQAYAQYHNALAQRYNRVLCEWEEETRKIQKKNASLTTRMFGSQKSLPERPTPPENPTQLHTFLEEEIAALELYVNNRIQTPQPLEPKPSLQQSGLITSTPSTRLTQQNKIKKDYFFGVEVGQIHAILTVIFIPVILCKLLTSSWGGVIFGTTILATIATLALLSCLFIAAVTDLEEDRNKPWGVFGIFFIPILMFIYCTHCGRPAREQLNKKAR